MFCKILLISLAFNYANSNLVTEKWNDEFDSEPRFLSNWNFETGNHGWGNNE
jgi:hypothetical protein